MMQKMLAPEVSIVMPVYNAENVLPGCLDSVVAQRFESMEILCIDDGSTDGSGDVLDEYARRDSRIRVIHQQNIGQYPTRNVGLREAKGRYILSIDCDDRVEPDLVEKVFHRAEADQADITLVGWQYLASPYQSPDVLTWNLQAWNSDPSHYNKFPMGYGYVWMKLYRKSFLATHDLRFREEFYSKADLIFHWKSMSLADTVCVVPEPLYHYRVHENSITGTIGKRFIQVIEVMEAIKADLVALDDPKGLLPAWYPFAFNFIYGAYTQLATEYRMEMRDAVRAFLARLSQDEQTVYLKPGRLPELVRYFYMSLLSPASAFRYGTLYRWRKHLTRNVKKVLLPTPIKRKLLTFVRTQSYNLSSSSAEDLRDSVKELNDVVNRLAVENYYLKHQVFQQTKDNKVD